MLAGVDILAKAVSVTLGPKGEQSPIFRRLSKASCLCRIHLGRNVIIEQPYGGPKITKGTLYRLTR